MLRKMGSFRSYVGLEEYEMKSPKTNSEGIQPDFLSGELVISEALNVLKFTSLSKKKGISGSLFVTNARVIFVSNEKRREIEDAVPLLSINMLWYFETSKTTPGAKKHRRVVKLGPSSVNNPSIIPSGSTRVHEILIACSNFKSFRYSFKFSPLDNGLRICNSIIHHSFPLQIDRLFYFDYSKAASENWRHPINSFISVPSFLEKGDWLKELNIIRSNSGYRISSANEGFQLCGSLPEWIIVPADLIDVKLISLAEKLKGTRPPHWSWADSKGGGILRMSKLNSENDCSAESVFFEVCRKAHPKKQQPIIIDLDVELPTKEIRQSFTKLFELCCPESSLQYEEMDSRFYSLLEHTKWMLLISKSLHIANYAGRLITENQDFIILQEHESRDTACLSSSLIQVLVDARFRTVSGFFQLIQKEWIAFGHPFHSTYMHTSPVLLLFLDCIQQLMKQNLVDFEFNDKLLATLWESSFDASRGTFIFDTPQQRKLMDHWKDHTSWGVILSDRDANNDNDESIMPVHSPKTSSAPLLPGSLANPLYKLKSLLYPPTLSSSGTYPLSTVLRCSSTLCDLNFWANLYLSRTFNIPSSIMGLDPGDIISSPVSTEQTNTPSSTSPEGSTETQFLYPQNSSKSEYYAIGRDPTRELKVVELLLAALSSSTRYRRHSPGVSLSQTNRTGLRDKDSKVSTGGFSYPSGPGASPTGPNQPYVQQQLDGKRKPFIYQQ